METPLLVDHPCLLHRARQPVEHIPARVLLGCLERFADHVQHDLVGNQLPPVQKALDLLPQVGLAGDVVAQQIAGGDVRNAEVLRD